MSTFHFSELLTQLIADKNLVEVHLAGAPTYKVAYLLGASEEFLTFAEVSSSATLSGVIMCRMDDVEAIKTETIYCGELAKQLAGDSLYQQAVAVSAKLEAHTFDGFMSAFAKTATLVEVTDLNENVVAGRVIDHDDKILVLDEFYAENDRRFGRSYISQPTIARLAVLVPWINTIARSLADKNL